MTNYDDIYARRVAERNAAEKEARLFEPRLFAASFEFTGTQQRIQAPPDVFRNGEKFPLRITHLVMQAQFAATDGQTPIGGDERIVQRYALRIRAHDTYYMNPLQVPLSLWVNKQISASDVITRAQSTWKFDKPVILGNRDAIEIMAALLVAPETGTERVAVCFEGVGRKTRQPKRLVGFVDLSTTVPTALDIADFRSDGTEPVELHSVTVQHTPSTAQSNPIGNIRNVRIRMRVNGNGTSQWWNWRESTAANQLVVAGLFGVDTGRAIVHRLPGDGWLWYPNEGISAEMESIITTRTDTILLGFVGYVIVL